MRKNMELLMYEVIAIEDGREKWKRSYDNCVDAVNAYNSFRDHGVCVFDYTITLIEPNGKLHTKTFLYPYSSESERNNALDRLGYPPNVPPVKLAYI